MFNSNPTVSKYNENRTTSFKSSLWREKFHSSRSRKKETMFQRFQRRLNLDNFRGEKYLYCLIRCFINVEKKKSEQSIQRAKRDQITDCVHVIISWQVCDSLKYRQFLIVAGARGSPRKFFRDTCLREYSSTEEWRNARRASANFREFSRIFARERARGIQETFPSRISVDSQTKAPPFVNNVCAARTVRRVLRVRFSR